MYRSGLEPSALDHYQLIRRVFSLFFNEIAGFYQEIGCLFAFDYSNAEMKDVRDMESMIQADLCVNGELTGRGDVRLEGRLEGKIDIDGSLFIGPEAQITASVVADSITVAGKIDGKTSARNEVRVCNTGCIEGDVIAPHVMIDTGGKIIGEVVQTDSTSSSNTSPPPIIVPVLGRIKARYKTF